MNLFNPPILGLEKRSSSPVPTTVVWQDGTVCGILNLRFDSEGAAPLRGGASSAKSKSSKARMS